MPLISYFFMKIQKNTGYTKKCHAPSQEGIPPVPARVALRCWACFVFPPNFSALHREHFSIMISCSQTHVVAPLSSWTQCIEVRRVKTALEGLQTGMCSRQSGVAEFTTFSPSIGECSMKVVQSYVQTGRSVSLENQLGGRGDGMGDC